MTTLFFCCSFFPFGRSCYFYLESSHCEWRVYCRVKNLLLIAVHVVSESYDYSTFTITIIIVQSYRKTLVCFILDYLVLLAIYSLNNIHLILKRITVRYNNLASCISIVHLISSSLAGMASSNAQNLKGYDHQFVDPPPDDLHCLICLSVARDPHQINCCGKVLCRVCLDEHKRYSNDCPQCRMEINSFADKRSELKPSYMYI